MCTSCVNLLCVIWLLESFFTLSKQSIKSRSILKDGSRFWDCLEGGKTLTYNRIRVVTFMAANCKNLKNGTPPVITELF